MMLLGLRNVVCSKEDWYYLPFYDIDRDITEVEIHKIDTICQSVNISYILYKTVNGVHFVSLTPVDIQIYAEVFSLMKGLFHSYYSGMTIRLSRKKDEVQSVIKLVATYGEFIPNLYNIYAGRFGYDKVPWVKETSKYLLVFEKYRSVKGENNEKK